MTSYLSSFDLGVNATFPAPEKALFSYMAIMESVAPTFLGTIFEEYGVPFRKEFPYPSDDLIVIQPAYLKQSMLPFTAQLLPIFSKPFYSGKSVSNQWSVIDTLGSSYNVNTTIPAFATDASTFNRSLGSVVEQLFHNLSMSLLSEPAFVKDSGEEALITLRHTRNIYSYRHSNLLLSYGLALGLSLLACIVGWVSVINNNASYSNRFSTVLRVFSRGNAIGFVAPEDCKGTDPLPRYLAKARIDLSQGTRVHKGEMESELELYQILEPRLETASGKEAMQRSEEDTADPQQRLIRPDELSRRQSSQDSRDGVEAQVHQSPDATIERNVSVNSSVAENEGSPGAVMQGPPQPHSELWTREGTV
jgi:hypothetical protein